MVKGFAALIACQLAGEALARGFGISVPGPVLGMVLLFLGLQLALRHGADPAGGAVDRVATGLLQSLALLFVPAGVGVVQHLGVLAQNGVALATALVVSTLATLVVTVLVFNALAPGE